jgi:cytoplasmic iron level regulating protein YaaA (DUF328/UPF0246 family)
MLILISPAKSLDFQTKFNCQLQTAPKFFKESEILAKNMQNFSIQDLENLQKISTNLAELNFSRWQNFAKSERRQALLAFDGDVYDGIEKEKYQKDDFEFAQENLRILSGLYGILRPLDLIAPYRLEMGSEFKNYNFIAKNLYQFWGDKITDELEKLPNQTIINLASNEYFSVVDVKKINKKIINIHFKDYKNGELKIVGINSKKMRGQMANHIILNRISAVEKLKNFSASNYTFDEKLSGENELVFVR